MGIYDNIENAYYDGIDRFVVITVATERNENLDRFEDTCKRNKIPYKVLGLGQAWESGAAENGVLLEPGGAQKIIYLRDEIKDWHDLENTVILFTDSYDVIFNDSPKNIMTKFRSFDSPMVFSAEKTCWPNQDLADEYPEVDGDYRFLNSGGFIGYGDHIMELVDVDIEKSDDDQEFYTNYYLSDENDNMVLDHEQSLFQTMNLALDDVIVHNEKVINNSTTSIPSVIHGNGPSPVKQRIHEMYYELYLSKDIKQETHKFLFNIFLDFEVKDIDQVFDQIRYLNYPKNNIHLRIYFDDDLHDYKISRFIEKFETDYLSVSKHKVNKSKTEKRDIAIKQSLEYNVDYIINFDCNYIFRNRESLKYLIEEDKNILSPMIVSEGSEWVNFWFRTDSDGYVVENENQVQIRNYQKRGTFSVGFLTGIIMFKSSILPNIVGLYGKVIDHYGDDDFDIGFSREVLRRGYQIWVTNKNYFGGVI